MCQRLWSSVSRLCVISRARHTTGDGASCGCSARRQVMVAAGNVSDQSNDRVTSGGSRSNHKILVVDDSSSVREALRDLLESNAFAVQMAGNAEEALKSMVHVPPDLILSDIMMPGGDGWLLQQEVRNSADFCEVPFVFITAVGSEDQRRLAIELGCDDFVRKPVDPLDLLSIIKGKLGAADKRRKSALRRLQSQHRKIVHTLSHEFRTPLVSVTTGAELLLEQFDHLSEAQSQKLIKTIYDGGRRLERLVNDFILLQQIDLGQAAWQSQRGKSKVPLVGLVEQAIETFLESIGNDRDSVKLNFKAGAVEGNPLYVNVYEVHASNVIQRLVSNAFKFSERERKIDVEVSVENQQANLRVRDYGPGLPKAEQLGRVCDLFLQINRDVQEQQGCGVGLTIARYLTELNGGTLTFGNPLQGPGLEARLCFPIA